jgi:hypothetical protein
MYEGQIIKKNFVLECWSLKDATTCVNVSPINIITSIVSIPTNFRSLSSTALATGTEIPYTAVSLAFTTESTTNYAPSHRWRADLFDNSLGWIPTTPNSGPFGYDIFNSGSSTQVNDANINNKPTVVTSANHSLRNLVLTATDIVAIYFVFQQTNWNNGNIVYDCNSFRITQSGSNGNLLATWKDDGSTTCTINVPVSNTNYYLVALIRSSGSSMIAYYNLSGGGAVAFNSVATALTTFDVNNSYIGRYNGITSSSVVRFAELMMFTFADIIAGKSFGLANYILSRYVEQYLTLNATIPTGNAWLDNE